MFRIISPLKYFWCEIWPPYCENQLLRTLWSSKIKRRAHFFLYIYLLSEYAYISEIYWGSYLQAGNYPFLIGSWRILFFVHSQKKRLFFVNTVRKVLELRTEVSNVFCTKKGRPHFVQKPLVNQNRQRCFFFRNFLSEDNRPWREDQSWKSTSSSRISNETLCQNLTFLAFF